MCTPADTLSYCDRKLRGLDRRKLLQLESNGAAAAANECLALERWSS